ncbi:hypothetical protein EDB81DRAFT_460794 [Dactylonectria macrodidyma]|uniref:2EXR domain-containing protein n=1 Tax=Dactylonectria macrodidyma TaxID=307937 RepID=A0A9P9EUZ7_9HYPO|nr:hypothetical protein EDB81DRAFT_460794 [Dactylonectria macrodidyma]
MNPSWPSVKRAQQLSMDSKSKSSDESKKALELTDLPLEIRELIWEFSLPKCRVFHVKSISQQRPAVPDTHTMYCKFHIDHAPPVCLYVCSEARIVALRKGFFLSPHGQHPGYWFSPEKDILYLDRNQRTWFHMKPDQPRMTVPGWDRVLNLGVEWRAFFRDIPRPSENETIASYWRASIDKMYIYMPRIRTINYILPKARYKGGATWGREPFGSHNFEAELLPLPEDTLIPWETSRNLGRAGPHHGQLITQLQMVATLAAPVVTWREVKRDIEKGFEEDDGVGDEEAQPAREGSPSNGVSEPPEILGWQLVRVGAPF